MEQKNGEVNIRYFDLITNDSRSDDNPTNTEQKHTKKPTRQTNEWNCK